MSFFPSELFYYFVLFFSLLPPSILFSAARNCTYRYQVLYYPRQAFGCRLPSTPVFFFSFFFFPSSFFLLILRFATGYLCTECTSAEDTLIHTSTYDFTVVIGMTLRKHTVWLVVIVVATDPAHSLIGCTRE